MLSRLLRFVGAALLCVSPLVGGWLAPANAQTTAPSATYEQANALVKERKFREAIEVLDRFIVTHPRDARAFVLRGDSKADLGDNEGALKDYNVAIGINPEYEYAYVTRCETRLQLGDSLGALQDCQEAIRLEPRDALAYEDRGDVYFEREEYLEALADYDQAIGLGRSNAYLFAARCDANRLTGNRERAAQDCEKALTLDPKSRRGLWARARLELTGARYQEAVADLNAYVAQSPSKSTTGYYFRGVALNRIQSYRLALSDLETYIQREPTDPDGYAERGVARYGLGDKDGALSDFERAQSDYRKASRSVAVEMIVSWLAALREGKPLRLEPR